jgi:hypothetical protein
LTNFTLNVKMDMQLLNGGSNEIYKKNLKGGDEFWQNRQENMKGGDVKTDRKIW